MFTVFCQLSISIFLSSGYFWTIVKLYLFSGQHQTYTDKDNDVPSVTQIKRMMFHPWLTLQTFNTLQTLENGITRVLEFSENDGQLRLYIWLVPLPKQFPPQFTPMLPSRTTCTPLSKDPWRSGRYFLLTFGAVPFWICNCMAMFMR